MSLRENADETQGMLSDPLDLDATLSQLPQQTADAETRAAWSGCQKYMLRCVARRALLHSALNTPSQVDALLIKTTLKMLFS